MTGPSLGRNRMFIKPMQDCNKVEANSLADVDNQLVKSRCLSDHR